MFSKEASKRLRQEFWIAFGTSFPRQWILYNTQVKGLALKFHFDLKKGMVSMDVVHSDLEKRMALWEKLVSLKTILRDDYLATAQFEDDYLLENQQGISRIYVEIHRVSIHDKNTWQETMEFLKHNMTLFEDFFIEYRDIISS